MPFPQHPAASTQYPPFPIPQPLTPNPYLCYDGRMNEQQETRAGLAGPSVATILYARTIINLPYRLIYPFLPTIARGLGVTLAEAGRLASVQGGVGLFAPLFGHLSDHYGRRRVMEAALYFMALATLLMALTNSYLPALLAFAGLGLAKALYDPALLAYVGDAVPYAQRGRAMALVELSWSFAWFFGVPLGGLLIERAGLRALWWVMAGLLVLAALATRRFLPPARHSRAAGEPEPLPWQALLRLRPVQAALVAGFAMLFSIENVFILYGAFLEERFGLALGALGLISAVISAAELLAEGGAAALTDRLGKKRSVVGGLLAFAAVLLALPALSGNLLTTMGGFALAILCFEFTIVSFIPLMSELVPAARATMLAMNVAAMGLGRLVAPLIGTALYQQSHSLLPNSLLSLTVCLVGALVLWRGVADEGGARQAAGTEGNEEPREMGGGE